VEQRVEDLLARMTLAEKIGQMTQVEKGSIKPADVTRYFIGSVISGGGGSPLENTPEGWARMVDGYQKAALAARLGIPILYGADAVHGHNNLKGAVIFPHNIGLGAANDPALVEEICAATAEELSAAGVRWNFAPTVAVAQDIRWGRAYESYGENTELVSALGAACVRGLQNAGGPGKPGLDAAGRGAAGLAAPPSVLATPKHYLGDGGTAWGSSAAPGFKLDQGDARVDEETLRRVFLPPYQAAIDAGARSIMVSFSSWNGVRMHANRYLLADVLKGELGFRGFLVSDWQAIDQLPGDYHSDVVASINAGLDMVMVPFAYQQFISTLTGAVERGEVPVERIDDAVRRILAVKMEMGLFEQPYSDPALLDTVGSAAHRALAREAAAKSLVLLKNENRALPAAKDAPLIFVGGQIADDIGAQCGGWTIEWQGRSGDITPGTTLLEAVRAAASEKTKVEYSRDGRFEGAALANLGIAVVGEMPYAEGAGDREDLSLSAADAALIQKMRERSQKLVVVIISGRPLVIADVLDQADAWVAAWLPGTEGQGVTDVLFGDIPFTGRLPFAWPASGDQLPLGPASPSAAGQQPLFPYGYGLK
jgi:beta-glucosidase